MIVTRLDDLPFWAPSAENEVIPSGLALGSNRRADAYVVVDRMDARSTSPSREYIKDSISEKRTGIFLVEYLVHRACNFM